MYVTLASGKPETTCGGSKTDVDIRDFSITMSSSHATSGKPLAHLINAKMVFYGLSKLFCAFHYPRDLDHRYHIIT